MGTAKSIEAYSACEMYCTDIDPFISGLSNRLNADFYFNRINKVKKHS